MKGFASIYSSSSVFSASCKSVTGAWLKTDSCFIKVGFLNQENEVVFEFVNCVT